MTSLEDMRRELRERYEKLQSEVSLRCPNFNRDQIETMFKYAHQSAGKDIEYGWLVTGTLEKPVFEDVVVGDRARIRLQLDTQMGDYHAHGYEEHYPEPEPSEGDYVSLFSHGYRLLCIGAVHREWEGDFAEVRCFVGDPESREYRRMQVQSEGFDRKRMELLEKILEIRKATGELPWDLDEELISLKKDWLKKAKDWLKKARTIFKVCTYEEG